MSELKRIESVCFGVGVDPNRIATKDLDAIARGEKLRFVRYMPEGMMREEYDANAIAKRELMREGLI